MNGEDEVREKFQRKNSLIQAQFMNNIDKLIERISETKKSILDKLILRERNF